MTEPMSHIELEKAILDVVRKINIENAALTAPVYSLSEVLALKNITALRKLGKLHNVKYYSKLSKPELINSIVHKMQQQNTLRPCLFSLEEIEWKFFQTVAAKEYLQTEKIYIDSYALSQNLGLIQCFYFENKLWFVVPDEIKTAYKKLSRTEFPEEKRFRDLLNNYAIAAVTLYGAISQDDFIKLFNSQNDRQIDIDKILPILLNNITRDSIYCFWDKYIVDSSFEEDDFKGVNQLLLQRKGKPRYSPSKEEFLRYADPDYYENTPQIKALQNHLSSFISDKDIVLDILDEIHDLIVAEMRMQEIFDYLDSAGIIFENMDQANTTIQFIIDVQNNTRLWSNYGYTPKELFAIEKSHLQPLPSLNPKIGRNSFCPCGSGKKYKNCCGKYLS